VQVEFITSAADLGDRPARILPEFSFVGRSNCGKSSLINYFLGRSKVAHTSRQPGKTRLMNYFLVNDRFYLVDLPGYGYAKVSKQRRAAWGVLLRKYLASQDRPLAVFHLLDVRHPPSTEDCKVSEWIMAAGHPFALAVTKIDKVGKSQLLAHYRTIVTALAVPPTTPFITTSAKVGVGRKQMWAWAEALLEAAAEDSTR
jgi:GTP-binding protein